MAKKVIDGRDQTCLSMSFSATVFVSFATRKQKGGAGRSLACIAACGGPTSGSVVEKAFAMAFWRVEAVSTCPGL
jgi:hypothetical protein